MKFNLFPKTTVLTLCSVLASSIALSAAINVNGTWKWTTEGRDGQVRESTLVLKQDGDKISGALEGRRGEMPISNAQLKGNELTFKIVRETQRGSLSSDYLAKVEGDTMKGVVKMVFGDRTIEREWTAKRAADVTGTWTWQAEGRDGQTWEATLKLKQEGNQVTGSIGREGSDWQVEIRNGKLDGSTLTFETVFERDGQARTMNNTATVSGNTMKGKVEGTRDGQAWSREWEAKRQ